LPMRRRGSCVASAARSTASRWSHPRSPSGRARRWVATRAAGAEGGGFSVGTAGVVVEESAGVGGVADAAGVAGAAVVAGTAGTAVVALVAAAVFFLGLRTGHLLRAEAGFEEDGVAQDACDGEIGGVEAEADALLGVVGVVDGVVAPPGAVVVPEVVVGVGGVDAHGGGALGGGGVLVGWAGVHGGVVGFGFTHRERFRAQKNRLSIRTGG